jgi:imidazolonepropionase-like amidohydrolase
MDADLVLLRGDPAAAIQVLDNVAYTLLQGRIIYRSADRR